MRPEKLSSTRRLTPYQQTMVATWEQHGRAEFLLKDPDAAIATMGVDPYIMMVGLGRCVSGRSAVYIFLREGVLAEHTARHGDDSR